MTDTYQYTLTHAQILDAYRRNTARAFELMHTRIVIRLASFCFSAALMTIFMLSTFTRTKMGGPLAAAAAVAAVAWILAILAQRSGFHLMLKRSSMLDGPREMRIHDDGIAMRTPGGESFTRWSGWRAVEEYKDLVLLYAEDYFALPVPPAAFATAEDRREFIERVRAGIAGAVPPATHSVVAIQPEPAPEIREVQEARVAVAQAPRWRDLVLAGISVAFFRRVPAERFAASWLQIVLIAAFSIATPILPSLVEVGLDAGRITWMHLPGALFHVSLILAAAAVTARLVGRRDDVSVVLCAGLLAWIVIDLLCGTLWLAIGDNEFSYTRGFGTSFEYLPSLWMALALGRFVITLVPAPAPRGGWVMIACALLIALPMGGIFHQTSLWDKDYTKEVDEESSPLGKASIASEDTFYRQPELLQRELDAIKPGRKGVVDVYLVGMAGYGDQDVFMREVDSVSQLFRERFDADGHIVKLVNNRKTVLSQPIASATSLKAALKRIAEVMDAEEDVVVLFLTSHGSANHRFSLQLWPLQFNELTPETLRGLLDESGIRNRVVIVSACYAGGFVPKLQNDDTLVITAAAADRNSFGCGNEEQWTFFGKAYFDEALRQTGSFTKAFEVAKPLIEQREKEKSFDPSMPQMSLGASMKTKLDELERQQASTKTAKAAEAPRASVETESDRIDGEAVKK
jgi:peptidase C13-like protein/YcxB-like protein